MTDAANPLHSSSGSTPVPDPTLLTTQQLMREIGALREVLEATIVGRTGVLETRLDGMDRAIVLLQTATDRLPAQMDTKVAQLKSLHEEKFNGVQQQFEERDVRVREAALSQTTAVNAALQAQKEAAGEQAKSFGQSIDKSEAATTKQIDAQGVAIQTAAASLDRQIGDLKERLTRIEAGVLGRTTATVDQRATAGEIRGYLAAGVSIVVAIVVVLTLVLK